jgi:hypothetical protein
MYMRFEAVKLSPLRKTNASPIDWYCIVHASNGKLQGVFAATKYHPAVQVACRGH